MLYTLPSRLGGFGLGVLSFNVGFQVYTGTNAFGEKKQGLRIPDILIEAHDRKGAARTVAIDYDPASTHEGEFKELSDIRRRNDLATVDKLTHFSITSLDLRDFEYLELLAERMRKALGARIRPALRGSMDDMEGRSKIQAARSKRRALWKQFVLPGLNRVIDDLPKVRTRMARRTA